MILDLNQYSIKAREIKHSALTVGVSRTKTGDNFGIMPVPSIESLRYLKELKPNPYIYVWEPFAEFGYDAANSLLRKSKVNLDLK